MGHQRRRKLQWRRPGCWCWRWTEPWWDCAHLRRSLSSTSRPSGCSYSGGCSHGRPAFATYGNYNTGQGCWVVFEASDNKTNTHAHPTNRPTPHYTQLRLKVTLTVLRHFQIKKRSPLLSKVVLQPCLSAHDIPVVLMGELEKSRVGKVR